MTRASILFKKMNSNNNIMSKLFVELGRYVVFRKDYRHVRSLPEYLLQDVGLDINQIDEADSANRLLR